MRTLTLSLALACAPALAAAQPVQVLHAFDLSPGAPSGALLEAPDGSFYGTSTTGIYRRAPGGQVTLVARVYGAVGSLLRGGDGALYGVEGGPNGVGAIFRFDPATGERRTLHAFSNGNDGGNPLGGLVEVGGQLYGVTTSGGPAVAPSVPSGTIFRLDPSTGALTILHAFSDRGTTPAWAPFGPLALGPDGLLYGTTRFGGSEEAGTIYRLNPATGAFAIVHAMTVAEGIGPVGPLLLDSDGAFYGAAYGGGDGAGAGTIFRFDPATSQLQRLYSFVGATDGSSPGPLAKGADGHLYGTADYGPVPTGSPRTPTLFRLRRTPAVTFETLRTFDAPTTGRGVKVQLVAGTDALLYGYGQTDGPTATGTIYRFDPLAGGPPSDPLSFTVLHTFPPEAWWPSRPTLSADGFLYGTTRFGGATNRGRVYRLSRDTGALTLLGTLPGGPVQTTDAWNSALVAGPDGLLYGTSHSATDTVNENRIVRVDPATGAASAAHERTDPTFPTVFYSSGPLARLSGLLYGLRQAGTSLAVFRFDPQTNAITDIATTSLGLWSTTSLLAATDSQLYMTAVVPVQVGLHTFRYDAQLRRVNLAAGTVDVAAALGEQFIVSAPVQGPGATVYVGGSRTVLLVDLQTNQVRPVCTIPSDGYVDALSVASDGTLFGTVSLIRQERFHCNPATGATTVELQSPQIGTVFEPFTTVPIDGLSYGAAVGGGPAGGGTLFRMAPTLAPPALDSDTDGLSNIWETAYGLDPFSSAGDAGAAGDPDHDGRTNAQELADGTHPRGTVTRYFAEGATGAFFHTRFDLGNPQQAVPAITRLRFLTDAGVTVALDVTVPPSSHVSIDPATLPGLANATFSTVVEADAAVGVDRSMTWDASGYGSHLETGVVAPSTTWYFAEGSTSGDFSLFYLLQNPEATAVTATVRFLRPAGAPIERTYTLPPRSRTTIPVDVAGPELVSTDVSAVITATAPIVAERAMYLNRPGQPFGAGHESAGVTAPALEWFLAEGATGAFFDLFVLIANPNPSPATVEVEYLLVGGGSLTKTYTVAANSRTTIWVDDEQLPAGSGQKPLASVAVSTTVRSTNSVPIIVERAMWWPGPALTANYWYEAHNSPGATTTATRWIMGGGDTGGPDAAETYVLIANTTTTPGRARVMLLFDTGAVQQRDYDLAAKSRTNVPIGQDFGLVSAARFAIVVESLGVPPVPIVVERATYASPGGVTWAAGGNALASPVP